MLFWEKHSKTLSRDWDAGNGCKCRPLTGTQNSVTMTEWGAQSSEL